MTCLYLRIYLIGYGAVYLYCYFAAVLRSFGDTVFQMLAMLVCTVLNGALDPLLIHGFGLQGAAAATVLSQGICLAMVVEPLRYVAGVSLMTVMGSFVQPRRSSSSARSAPTR